MQGYLQVLCIVLAATVVSEASAHATPASLAAKQITYVDVHRPDHAGDLYRVVGGSYLFIGDPVPFGYDGPKHVYAGRHPIPVDELVSGEHHEHDGTVYC